ncbi:MAG: hypothetical protein JWP91_2788 [Fibrobacteres bacterium]|nr:hypothetical protein [Fibrobacterota bacterium]
MRRPITSHAAIKAFTGLAALAVLSTFTACSHNAIMKPKADILQYGNYRSRVEAAPGAMTGLSLNLNGNGRFSLATMDGGCFVAEDWGAWSSTQEELSLRVQKSMRRASCSSAWQTVRRDTAFICPMRSVTDRSFQMLHDEIRQGTVWTEWEREASQGYAELERLRMEPEADAVTLNSESDGGKSSPEKARAGATRRR